MRKITLVFTTILMGMVGAVSGQTPAAAPTTSAQIANNPSLSLEVQAHIQHALERAQANIPSSNRALAATYVGSFNTNDGPNWTENPPALSAIQAAALIFGGSPSDYVISTNPDTTDPLTITHTAWATTWGVPGCTEVAEDYFLDLGAPGYNDPGGTNSAISAYVTDNCTTGNTNYVWRVPTLPIIVCPGDNNVSNDPGVCGAVVNYTVSTTDPQDGALTPIQTAGLPSGAEFPIGTTTNTYEVTDSDGNTVSCSFDVTVNDTEAPVISCPGDIVQENDPGQCGAVVNYTVTVNDNCDGGAASEYVINGGFETGDFSGWSLVDTGSGSYYINDGTFTPSSGAGALPPISGNFDVVTNQGGAGLHMLSQPFVVPGSVQSAVVSWNDRIRNMSGVFSDPNQEFRVDLVDASLNVIQEIYSTNPGDPATQIGPNYREFDLTALLQTLSGQQVSLRFSEQDDMGFFHVSLDDISFVIESINSVQTAGLPSGSTFPVGTTTNTFEVTDSHGNTASCSFDVTINDMEAPIISCSPDIALNNDPGVCGAVVTYPDPTITDNCEGTSGELVVNGTADNGLTGWNITQNGGNGWAVRGDNKFVTSYSLCAKSQVIDLLAVGYSEAALDASPDIVVSEDYVGGWPNYADEYFYRAELRDANGVALASFNTGTLICSSTVQTVSHTFTGYPAGVRYIYIEHGGKDSEWWIGHYGAVIDNSKAEVRNFIWSQTAGLPSGSVFPVGTTTNTFVTTDVGGNTASCSFDVTVTDNEAPLISCVPNQTRNTDPGICGYTVVGAEVDASFTDNCTATLTNDYNGTASLAGEVLPKGATTVVWTVEDGNGQTATCTMVITVEDNEAPVVNCAPSPTRDTDLGLCQYTIVGTELDATFSDNCSDGSITNDLNGTATLAGEILPTGDTTVVWTVNDGNGQTTTCTSVITIADNEMPAIACPSDITSNSDLGECSAVVYFPMPIAVDNCGIDSIVQTMGAGSGSQFPVGSTSIEFTVTDINGNSSVCGFTITVIDNEAPVAVCQNLTIQLDASGNASITAADVDGGSTDQCGVASMAIDVSTFDCSDVGDNNVILTVTDVNGNSSTCTAVVTVEDITAPMVACQDITVELDPVTGTVSIAGTDIDNGSTDACGIGSYDLDIDTFDCSNIGENTVVLTVTDVNGNAASCTAIVTVEDNTSPVLVCQDFTLELGADGTATLTPADVIASNDDVCGILTTAVDITEFSCGDIGTPITVQVFSQDNNGNLATCMATVTVVDNLAPVVVCPADQTVDPGPGNLFYIVPDYFATAQALAIDNCTNPVTITSQDPVAGTALSDGTYTITLTATDEYGNTGSCQFELAVESVLGVGNNGQNLDSIVMYPNPAKGNVTIGNPQGLKLDRADIYDLMGRLVQSHNLKGMTTAKTLNLGALAAATYVVIIKGQNGQLTKRLIKE